MTRKTITSKPIINFKALLTSVFLLILLLEAGVVRAGEGKTKSAADDATAKLNDYLSTASVYG